MNPENKILSLGEFINIMGSISRPLVMTNGVFDIIHRGHVSYLHQASKLGSSLVVALNSDISVRMLGKGLERPYVPAEDRAYVLAGLASVDWLIFFDEPSPVELIKLVRPEVYVKGGDYNMDIIEESNIVRSWGGDSIAIPFVDGFSTTSLVTKIRSKHAPLRKAAFLDRDGVINKDKGYVHRWKDFEFLDGAIEGMQMLQNSGYELVIVTNQSGLARGYYTTEDYDALSLTLRRYLESKGVKLAGIYHCPHHPNGSVELLSAQCTCRKPKPGLIQKAAYELGLDLRRSLLIGDRETDIQAARAANVNRTYLVSTDGKDLAATASEFSCSSLYDCAKHILMRDKISATQTYNRSSLK
jgi:D-glycero-D-manno-heptose 1,7-bisphosphate phosphatase